jgi:hypothetical protein
VGADAVAVQETLEAGLVAAGWRMTYFETLSKENGRLAAVWVYEKDAIKRFLGTDCRSVGFFTQCYVTLSTERTTCSDGL